MRLQVLAIALPLLGLASAGTVAQENLVATAPGGPSYDVVANCLMKRMTPVLTAVPVVRPPPTNEAEVYLYVHGTRETGSPVANFVVRQQADGSSTIRYEGPGQYAAAATAAARQCAR